jgi:hypothetical protein
MIGERPTATITPWPTATRRRGPAPAGNEASLQTRLSLDRRIRPFVVAPSVRSPTTIEPDSRETADRSEVTELLS